MMVRIYEQMTYGKVKEVTSGNINLRESNEIC